MLNSKSDKTRDFTYLDKLSTEELQEIIRQDYTLDRDEETDMEVILYIMEVLARREKEENINEIDVEASWDEFQKEYYPYASDQTPLYSFSENSEVAPEKPKRFRGVARTVGLVAAVAAVLISGTAAAYAFGYDILGEFAAWTHEKFSFSSNRDNVIPFNNLRSAMKMHDIEDAEIPNWLPEGYGEDVVQITNVPDGVYFVSSCKGQGWEISISISAYDCSDTGMREYEGQEKPVETYESAGTTYYITDNGGMSRVSWSVSNLECSILSDLPTSDLFAVINSIY